MESNLPQIPLEEIEAQFRAFMKDNNCEPLDNISLEMDGKIKRYRVLGDNRSEKTGAYFISIEGYPHGWCQNWREGNVIKWALDRSRLQNSTLKKSITDDVMAKMIEASKAHQAEMQKQLQAIQTEASDKARALFETLPSVLYPHHKYLRDKRVLSYGFRLQDDKIVIPLSDINGNFKSIQWISPDSSKKFFPDAPVKGAFFSIGSEKIQPDNADKITIFVCEGAGTCSNIYELTQMPTFAAMTCGNIFNVAQALKSKYPQHKIVIMADNDHNTKGNPGITAANKAKEELDLYGVIYPDFPDDDNGTDWNDYYSEHGLEATQNHMREKYAEIVLIARRNKYKAMASECGVMLCEDFNSFCNPIEGENFIIEDWIPTQSLMMLFAPSGSGKGFIAIDMAVAIACDEIKAWHGKRIIRHGPVVYLAGEGQKGMRKRCAGLTEYKCVNRNDVKIAIIKEALDIDNKDKNVGVKKVIANIGIRYPNPSLIIIDTLNCYMGGDENKTVDATAFVKAAKEIMQEFNCSVMIIHHTGLNPDNQGRVRGSSVLKAAMDMEFRVKKVDKIITLEMTKSKDSEIQKPLVFEMIKVPAPGFFTETGFQDTTCVLEFDEETSENISSQEISKEKLSPSEVLARETYQIAASKYGNIMYDITGKEYIGVFINDWREVFYEMSSADNEDTRRKQFDRARKNLLETKKFLFKTEIDKHDFYCLYTDNTVYNATITTNIRARDSKNTD